MPHTEGPWKVTACDADEEEARYGPEWAIVNEAGAEIAVVFVNPTATIDLRAQGVSDGFDAENGSKFFDELRANAHALAAAPKLLAVCKAMHRWLGKLTDWEGAPDPPLDELRAAIAEAEEIKT